MRRFALLLTLLSSTASCDSDTNAPKPGTDATLDDAAADRDAADTDDGHESDSAALAVQDASTAATDGSGSADGMVEASDASDAGTAHDGALPDGGSNGRDSSSPSNDAAVASDGGPADADARRPLFAMDYSAGAALQAGWSQWRADDAFRTTARIAGAGPSGQDAYRLTALAGSATGTEFYWGHVRSFSGGPFAYGRSVFLRWRFRWVPGTDCRCYESGSSNPSGVYRNKILILNDGSSSVTSRFIMQLGCEASSPVRYFWSLQKGGGVDMVGTPEYADLSTWRNIQIELHYSSAAGIADGAYRMWVDSHTTPTAERTGIVLNADMNPGAVQFGAYSNMSVAADGHIAWEHADFQIDDEFDPAW